MRIVLAAASAAVATALAPSSAFAVDYLNVGQAARLMFPDADHFEPQTVTLDAARLRRLAQPGVTPRSARWSLLAARQGGATLGWVVADAVTGKFELIDYAVGVGVDGRIRQVEILSYRESHGFEVRLPAWRRQFIGKTAAAPIAVGEDIANISGATLSCTHLTDGVRRIVALIALARHEGLLR
jgi:hypothetical protein